MSDSCVWPVDRTCLPSDLTSDEDKARLQEAVDTAVGVLWALTGRQFGCQRLVTRPCPGWDRFYDDYIAYGLPGIGFSPVLHAGVWRNVGCGTDCVADGPGVIRLPGPVAKIENVTVDGVIIDPTSYKLEGNRLYRLNDEEWPSQNLRRPAGEPGTWTVQYLRGTPPPAGAAMAVGQLTKEFWAVCTGQKCRLPKRTMSVQRQGLTITRADPTDLLANKQTGLPEIDMWIAAHNPNKLDQPTKVGSPDLVI